MHIYIYDYWYLCKYIYVYVLEHGRTQVTHVRKRFDPSNGRSTLQANDGGIALFPKLTMGLCGWICMQLLFLTKGNLAYNSWHDVKNVRWIILKIIEPHTHTHTIHPDGSDMVALESVSQRDRSRRNGDSPSKLVGWPTWQINWLSVSKNLYREGRRVPS